MLENIIKNNQNWAKKIKESNPDFFKSLSKGQTPKYLFIGCSDSRMPATQLLGLMPGDVFVHRNIANTIDPNDKNAISVIQYAVTHLKVKHILVCGHTCCGGLIAAIENNVTGTISDWIKPIQKNLFTKQTTH